MIDIVGSIIGLILASPLMFYVAYRIRKEEPGSPIFFSHTRVGKNGKTFKMHKFRSMCLDAEEKLEQLSGCPYRWRCYKIDRLLPNNNIRMDIQRKIIRSVVLQ